MIQPVTYSYTVTPFQGSTIFATYSQGVALGWYVTALQAYKPYRLSFDLISSALSQINYLFVPPSKWAKLEPSPLNDFQPIPLFDKDPVYWQVKKRVIYSSLRNCKAEISN